MAAASAHDDKGGKESTQRSQALKDRRQGLAVGDLIIPGLSQTNAPRSYLANGGPVLSTIVSRLGEEENGQQGNSDAEAGILKDEELRGWVEAHGVQGGPAVMEDLAQMRNDPTTKSMPSFKAWPAPEKSPELKVKRQLSGSLRLLRTISRRASMPALQHRHSDSLPLVSPEKPAEARMLDEKGHMPRTGGKAADAFAVDEALFAEGARRISVLRRVQSVAWDSRAEARADKIDKMLLKRAVLAHFQRVTPVLEESRIKVPQTAPASHWAGQVRTPLAQGSERTPSYPMSGPVLLAGAKSEGSLSELLQNRAGSWKVRADQSRLASTPELSPRLEGPPAVDSSLLVQLTQDAEETKDAEDTSSSLCGPPSGRPTEPPTEEAPADLLGGCPRTQSGRFIVADAKRKVLQAAIDESVSLQEGTEILDGSVSGDSLKPSSLQPLEKQLNSIDLTQLFLGEKVAAGSFGRLYRGEYKKQEVAVKMLRATSTQEAGDEIELQFLNEVHVLSQLSHPNIVRFVGAYCKPPVRAIVMEFMRDGSVREWLRIREGQPLLPLQLIDMATDIANGMAYLHSRKIVHRDLKSENLLFASDGTIKVADFGEAYFLGSKGSCQGEIGTYRWMAPEVLAGKPYNQKVDVYSFGLVLWELLTLKIPFDEMTGIQAAYAVVAKNLRPPIPRDCPVGVEQLMTSCWATNPKKRPEFTEVLEVLKWIADDVAQEGGFSYAGSSRGKRRCYYC